MMTLHDLFLRDSKVVSKVVNFLKHINNKTYFKISDPIDPSSLVSISRGEKIKYLGDRSYNKILSILIDNNYLVTDNSYIAANLGLDRTACKSYGITELGQEQLLHYMLNELPTQSKLNKMLFKKRQAFQYSTINAASAVCKHQEIIHANANVSINTIKSIMDAHKYPMVKRVYTLTALERLFEEKFIAERSQTNSRIHTFITSMPREIRRSLLVSRKKATHEIDIMACHMQFLGMYLKKINSSPTDEFIANCDKWTEFWTTSKNVIPRDVLRQELFGDSQSDKFKDAIKEVIVSYINGMDEYAKSGKDSNIIFFKVLNAFDAYVKKNYPAMIAFWKTTDTKTTGVMLTKLYETAIMQNDAIYNYAFLNDFYCNLEHDGVTLFGASSEHAHMICAIIAGIAKELFNMNLRIKIQTLQEEV